MIVIPAATEPDALRALVPALTGTGPLSTAAEDVPTTPVTVRDKEVIAALAPRTPPDQQPAVDGARTSRVTVDGFRSMTAGADPDSATWELLNAQTLSTAMDGPERTATHARIQESVDTRLAAIEVPRSRRVVLTSREATIPLRFRNDLPYEVRLLMRTRSPAPGDHRWRDPGDRAGPGREPHRPARGGAGAGGRPAAHRPPVPRRRHPAAGQLASPSRRPPSRASGPRCRSCHCCSWPGGGSGPTAGAATRRRAARATATGRERPTTARPVRTGARRGGHRSGPTTPGSVGPGG